MSQLRLAVGIPAYGANVAAEHTRMWMEFGATMSESSSRFMLTMFGYVDINGIDNARNKLVQMATEVRADWLLMIDADTWVERYGDGYGGVSAGVQLARMISEADRAGAAIVGAPVVRRIMEDKGEREIMAYREVEWEETIEKGCNSTVESYRKLEPISKDELATHTQSLLDVDAVATAVFAVRLSAIGFAKFAFTERLSEDLEFCRQIRSSGGKIFVDRRVNTGHKSRQFALYARSFE